SGAVSPARSRNRVLFPEPFGPTRATLSPAWRRKSACSRTSVAPQDFRRSRPAMIGSMSRGASPLVPDEASLQPRGARGVRRSIHNATTTNRAEALQTFIENVVRSSECDSEESPSVLGCRRPRSAGTFMCDNGFVIAEALAAILAAPSAGAYRHLKRGLAMGA